MRRTTALVLCTLLFLGPTAAISQRNCTACNIVSEYGIRYITPGSTYFNFDGNPITVVQVDYQSRRVLAYAAGYPNGRRSWIPAENVYTEQRVFERQQTVGLAASCVAYDSALRNDSILGAMLMRGACCDSSAARRYGSPSSNC